MKVGQNGSYVPDEVRNDEHRAEQRKQSEQMLRVGHGRNLFAGASQQAHLYTMTDHRFSRQCKTANISEATLDNYRKVLSSPVFQHWMSVL